MKGKAIIPLALGLGLGLIAVKVGVDAIKRAQGASPAQETMDVVVAKVDINAHQQITPEMLDVIKTTDSKLIPAQARISVPDDIVGRVTSKFIPQQAPVLKNMLAEPGTTPGMVGRIPKGHRAVSVKIDEVTGVAYQVKPGDWVDVIVVMDIQHGNRRNRETIAETILQGVQVAAIGQTVSANDSPGSAATAKPAKSATLFVAESDAPKLHLAQTRGKITLVMRGEDDKDSASPVTVSESDVIAALRGDKEDEDKEPKPTPEPEPTQVAQVEPEPEPEPDPPFSVLVVAGKSTNDGKATVQNVTFENANSGRIVSVSNNAVASEPPTLDRFSRSRRGSQRDERYDRRTRPERDEDAFEPGYENPEMFAE